VFPVSYEHYLHIKSKAIPVTGRGDALVFPVRYEHYLHIKSKTIPITGRGGPWGCEMLIPHCLHSWLTDGCEVILMHYTLLTLQAHFLFEPTVTTVLTSG
jgi:hypothetical protein